MSERGARSGATGGEVPSLPLRALACLILWAVLATAFASEIGAHPSDVSGGELAPTAADAKSAVPMSHASDLSHVPDASHGHAVDDCGSACVVSCASGGALGERRAPTVPVRRARVEAVARAREAGAGGPSSGVPLRPPRVG